MNYVKRKRKLKWSRILIAVGLVLAGTAYLVYPLFESNSNQATEITETEIVLEVGPDYNNNGLSDTQDIVLGARADALAKPDYINAYYSGGYPPETEGTCTDLVWRAFMAAGYSLKDMVDADIKADVKAYPGTRGEPDPNIDFRRVQNLSVFFKRNAETLTLDVYDTEAWQAGDIVIFGNNEHIGIVSDIRNENDIPLLIHNNDQADREEDRLEYGDYTMGITGHYRFISLQP